MRTASRFRLFNDTQWELISGLLPSNEGRRGHPFGDDRRVVEGIIYRYRTGVPGRDLPRSEFGPWQTVWKRHHRFSLDGTWDNVLAALQSQAQTRGEIDWRVSVDSTIARVHQHGATAPRTVGAPPSHTGGTIE